MNDFILIYVTEVNIKRFACTQIFRPSQKIFPRISSYLLTVLIFLNYYFFQNRDESGKRDYLFYLAIGNARIKEYQTALKFVRGLLQVEPGNRQAQELEAIIKKKMEKEGLIGMAVVGGATLALGGLVGLGIALAKSSKS